MTSINDLNLTDDRIEIPEDIPEQMGGFAPPPQPGRYRFKLPNDLSKIWDVAEEFSETVQKKIGGKMGAVAVFSSEFPLIITQSKGGEYDGEPFETKVKIAPRHRGNDVYVSDMYYLLNSGLGHDMAGCKNWTQKEWARALMTHVGQEFAADITWRAFCSERRVRYIEREDGSSFEDPSGEKGCGGSFYQRDIPRNEDGSYPPRFVCLDCQIAVVLCFGGLERFCAIAKG